MDTKKDTRPLLLVDLDTTLFNTSEFWDDFVKLLRDAAKEPWKNISLTRDTFTSGVGRVRHTNYSAILSAFHLSHSAVKNAFVRSQVPKTYLFDDALTWLENLDQFNDEWNVRILTCGTERYQKLKIRTHPILQALPCEFVLANKNDYIVETFPNVTGVLIDDKPNQNLPPGWVEIRIDRFNSRPVATEDAVVTSLTQVTPTLLNMLHENICKR